MMPVASSYGPFGRSVLLYNETVLLHTRDSQQILTQMQSSTTFLRTPSIVKVLPMVSSSISSISSYEAYLLKVLFKYNSQSSDGLGTLSMQFQCLLSQLSSNSSKHSLELLTTAGKSKGKCRRFQSHACSCRGHRTLYHIFLEQLQRCGLRVFY